MTTVSQIVASVKFDFCTCFWASTFWQRTFARKARYGRAIVGGLLPGVLSRFLVQHVGQNVGPVGHQPVHS
jgi:hypothetical protein